MKNNYKVPFIGVIAVILLFSCRKIGPDPSTQQLPPLPDGEISYWYEGEYRQYRITNRNYTAVKTSGSYQDVPHHYYNTYFSFSSSKTSGNIMIFLYNDTLYPGQQFRPGAWQGTYEEYAHGFFTSNSLQVMIPTKSFSPADNYFYATRDFFLTIDTVAGGMISGRFGGTMVCYIYEGTNMTQYTDTDTLVIEQGKFHNLPVQN